MAWIARSEHVVPYRYALAAGRICRQRFPEIHFAAHLLPRPQRNAVLCLAAAVDQVQQIIHPPAPTEHPDAASSSCGSGCCGCHGGDERRRIALAVIDHLYRGEPTGKPELDGFLLVLKAYRVPSEPFQTAIDAALEHAGRVRYATWSSLYDMCRRTAGPFASLALPILAPGADTTAHTQAISLAAAMRATHLLLHAGEEGRAGRVTVPLDDLVRFGLTDRQWLAFAQAREGHDERLTALVRFQIERLSNLFAGGLKCRNAIDNPRIRRAIARLADDYIHTLQRIESGTIDIFDFKSEPRDLWQRVCDMLK